MQYDLTSQNRKTQETGLLEDNVPESNFWLIGASAHGRNFWHGQEALYLHSWAPWPGLKYYFLLRTANPQPFLLLVCRDRRELQPGGWARSGQRGTIVWLKLNHRLKREGARRSAATLRWTSSTAAQNEPHLAPRCQSGLVTVPLITVLMLNTNGSAPLPRIPADYHRRAPANMTVTIYASTLPGILTFGDSVLSCIHFHL